MAVDWSKPLEQWTEEEIAEARQTLGHDGGGGETEKKKEKVSATLPDGTRVEADDYEALSKLMNERLAEAYEKDTPVPVPREQPQPQAVQQQFNMEEFAKKFTSNPADAMEYLDMTTLGFSSKKALASSMLAVNKLYSRLQDMEVERFLDNTPEYKPSKKNMSVITEYLNDNGWDVSYGNLKKAFALAKEDGAVTLTEQKKEAVNAPPRMRGSAGSGGVSDAELPQDILDTARRMPMEKLEEFLFNKGTIKTRRFS